jgi:FtsZ-interacting cell division protein ZipA
VLVGVELFGILGALLAIPAAGVMQVIIRDLWDHRTGKPKVEMTIGEDETPVTEVIADKEADQADVDERAAQEREADEREAEQEELKRQAVEAIRQPALPEPADPQPADPEPAGDEDRPIPVPE